MATNCLWVLLPSVCLSLCFCSFRVDCFSITFEFNWVHSIISKLIYWISIGLCNKLSRYYISYANSSYRIVATGHFLFQPIFNWKPSIVLETWMPIRSQSLHIKQISMVYHSSGKRWRGKPQPQIPPTHLPSLQFQLRLLSNSGGQWDYQNTVVDPPLSKGPRTEIVNISKMTCKLNIFQLQLIVNCANGFTFTPNDDVSHTHKHTSTQSQCHSNDINVMMELNHNDLWCAFSQWLDLKIVLCGRSQFTLSFSSFSSSAYNGSVDSLETGKSGICSWILFRASFWPGVFVSNRVPPCYAQSGLDFHVVLIDVF